MSEECKHEFKSVGEPVDGWQDVQCTICDVRASALYGDDGALLVTTRHLPTFELRKGSMDEYDIAHNKMIVEIYQPYRVECRVLIREAEEEL